MEQELSWHHIEITGVLRSISEGRWRGRAGLLQMNCMALVIVLMNRGICGLAKE